MNSEGLTAAYGEQTPRRDKNGFPKKVRRWDLARVIGMCHLGLYPKLKKNSNTCSSPPRSRYTISPSFLFQNTGGKPNRASGATARSKKIMPSIIIVIVMSFVAALGFVNLFMPALWLSLMALDNSMDAFERSPGLVAARMFRSVNDSYRYAMPLRYVCSLRLSHRQPLP